MIRRVAAFATAVVAVLAGRSTALVSPPAPSDYDYDGVTTYCYWIKQGMDVESFDYAYVHVQGKNSECPLLLSITQLPSNDTLAGADVPYQVMATLNLDGNKFNMTKLETTVPDPATRRSVEIAHANVHACSRPSVCDVFRSGDMRRISDQQTANFTENTAVVKQTVNFAVAGMYNVFAHVVLPSKNVQGETYQFVAFTTTTISPLDKAFTSGGTPAGTVVGGVIVGVMLLLVAVAVVTIYRHRRLEAAARNLTLDHKLALSGYSPTTTASTTESFIVVMPTTREGKVVC